MLLHRFRQVLLALVLYSPAFAFAVTLNPGNVGNFFTWTNTGTVDALDGGGFAIELADQKYITITPYAVDARFLFGIDFNSSGLEPTAISGYLTDAAGNEIAGTAFTGLAISAGFGGGSITLNEVVIAYGLHITFTGTPPALPFPVRLGSGVASNVFEHRPVIGQDITPEPGEISIDSVAACAGPEFFEFAVAATGVSREMVISIGADSEPDPLLGPTERITTGFNAMTGEINSEAEPIAESFGTPPFDRWLDGALENSAVERVGNIGTSWLFSAEVRNGAQPFIAGDTLWGVTLSEDGAEVATGPLVVEACDPRAAEIVVPSRRAPVLNGRIDYREWPVAAQIELAGGSITFMHDKLRLFVLINMREDGTNNPLRDGGPDQFSLVFDIDEDSDVSPDLDRRYRLLAGSGNFRFETFADPWGSSFNPPEDISFSAMGEGFGCFLADGSATITPLSCYQHRVWEVAMDLLEIEASGDKTARLGIQVQSETDVIESLPADLDAFADFIRLRLSSQTNLDEPSRGLPTTPLSLAELRVTQGIQNEDNSLPLVLSRDSYADILVDTEEELAESVTTSLFVARDGVDLPGSPFTFTIPYNHTFGSANRRDGPARQVYPVDVGPAGTEMSLRLIARQPLLQASLSTPEYRVPLRNSDTPVYWIVPFNTGDSSTPNLPSGDFLLRSQLEVRAVFPVADVDFVQRPAVLADPETKEDAITLLNQYDQQAVLAWTLGLLITGEPPFTLPDQIIGAFPADKDFGGTIGLSDPHWWFGGAGRVVWIKEVTADAGLLLPHELNHNLDTNVQGSWGRHVMGCGSEGLDPHWPYTNREIQEPALVTENVIGRNERLLTPTRRVEADTPDYMSYCRARFSSRATDSEAYPYQWLSPYRWLRQLDRVFSTNTASLTTARSSASTADAGAMLYITGQVMSDGSGSLDPVLRQPGVPRAGHRPGAYTLRLADCLNQTLHTVSFDVAFTDVEGQPRDSTPLAMVLPDNDALCSVELHNCTLMLAQQTVSANSPQVDVIAPNGGEFWSGIRTVQWQATDVDGGDLSVSILYSLDGGGTWLPIASGVSGGQYTLDSDSLPGSGEALIRVLVTDGLNTSEDDSDSTFQVAAKPPTVRIVTPAAGSESRADEAVLLRGIARDTVGRELAGDTFLWRLDGEAIAVGNGVGATLEPGDHQLTLEATAANGLSGQDAVNLSVQGVDSDGDGVPDDDDSCPGSLPGTTVSVVDCPTGVENRITGDGCSIEELVNTMFSENGRDALIKLLKNLRKQGELHKEEVKAIKKCVPEDEDKSEGLTVVVAEGHPG